MWFRCCDLGWRSALALRFESAFELGFSPRGSQHLFVAAQSRDGVGCNPSAAEAVEFGGSVNAALEALRHPKALVLMVLVWLTCSWFGVAQCFSTAVGGCF